ncbi:hypothetical protein KI387_010265 [Taxus chinensis]|uniref:F-box protein n=1 Tax=Taxus chinensis TaxID=29808 RepID=A0AA38FKU1_TAXCH|nr:hypothetical protein KI387_010265 [Taxus chinensis]
MKRVVQESCYLFPQLPEELEGRECLLRVPYEWHDNLRAVNKRWKEVVNSPQFYQDRKRLAILEPYICLVQDSNQVNVYHPSQNRCRSLPLPPIHDEFGVHPYRSECISVNYNLIFMGGSVWINRNNLPERHLVAMVVMYNFSRKQWLRGADMPIARTHFACSVSPEGLVYIAGGESFEIMAEREATVYHTEEDRREILPVMKQGERRCSGAFLEGKFFVITHEAEQIFDVKTRKWTFLDDLWRCSEFLDRNLVTAHGRLYLFEGQSVMEYNCEENVLAWVGFTPRRFILIECLAVCGNGEKVFVYGWDKRLKQVCYIYSLPTKETSHELELRLQHEHEHELELEHEYRLRPARG